MIAAGLLFLYPDPSLFDIGTTTAGSGGATAACCRFGEVGRGRVGKLPTPAIPFCFTCIACLDADVEAEAALLILLLNAFCSLVGDKGTTWRYTAIEILALLLRPILGLLALFADSEVSLHRRLFANRSLFDCSLNPTTFIRPLFADEGAAAVGVAVSAENVVRVAKLLL